MTNAAGERSTIESHGTTQRRRTDSLAVEAVKALSVAGAIAAVSGLLVFSLANLAENQEWPTGLFGALAAVVGVVLILALGLSSSFLIFAGPIFVGYLWYVLVSRGSRWVVALFVYSDYPDRRHELTNR